MRKALLAVALTTAFVFLPAVGAHADTDDLQERVDAVLVEFPGGTQTSPNTVEWDNGAVELTLATDEIASRSIGSCATGAYCVFSAPSLGGSKLSFTTCDTTVSTSPLKAAVASLANARTTGYIMGKNSTGGVLTQINAGGTSNNAPGGITQVKCVS